MKHPLLLPLLALLFTARLLVAQDTPAPLLDQKRLVEAARAVTLEKYPDAENALIAAYTRTHFETNGAYSVLAETYTKVLTEQGRRGAREAGFSYNSFYGGLKLLAVQVIKPDGKVIDHNPADISKEQIDRSQMSANIYDPNNKVVAASIPNLEIGDLLRVFHRQWENIPRFAGTFSDITPLESTQPILEFTCEYFGPKDKPLQSKVVLAEVPGTVTHEQTTVGDQTRYLWTARQVPQLFPEARMPSFLTVCQRLLVSTASDWREVSRWYWKLCEPHFQVTTPDMEVKAKELAATGKTDEEKIRAIFKWVSQEVRYMGITTEKEAPGYEPHDVSITFKNRYGVCRDKAALLTTMLRSAGFEAFPTLVSAGRKLDPQSPSCFFNHAITAVRGKDKQFIFMDSTDEHTADLLPKYLSNQSMLVATPEGETLVTSPIDPAEANLATVQTEVTLDDNGAATGTARFLLGGINDNSYRGAFLSRKPDEIRRYFESLVKSQFPGGSLTDFEMTPKDLQNTAEPLRFRLGFSAPSLLASGGGVSQLDIPYAGRGVSVVSQLITSGLGLDKRRFPLETKINCALREELTVKLPAKFGTPLALPDYQSAEHSDFSIAMTIKHEAGPDGATLRAVRDLKLKSPVISPEIYLELKQAVAGLERNSRQKAIFSRTDSASAAAPKPTSDVEIISRHTTMKVEDAHTWSSRDTVKKKILTYAGKKANSELTLDYNPAWATVAVEDVTVTQQDGTVKKLEAQEINTLDAAWVSSAPRYPGGKTLVVALPGVEMGALVEYTIVQTARKRPMLSLAHAFATSERLNDYTLVLDFPAALRPKLRVDFSGHVVTEEKNDRRISTYTWRNLEPVAREPAAPPMFVEFPDLILSTGDWAAYAKAVQQALAPRLANQPATAAKAKELTAGLTDPVAKIIAIRDFVAKQIRRAGPSFGALPLDAAFTPADTVLKDGYGHGGDRAILLHALLAAAGFQPELVLADRAANGIPEFAERDVEFPAASTYEALVVRLPAPTPDLEPGILFDNYSQYSALGATDLDGKPGLRLDGTMFQFRAPASRRDLSEDTYEVNVLEDGAAEITVIRRHHGTAHESFVQGYREMTPEDFKRHQQQLVNGISQNAKLLGELSLNYDYPGTQRYQVRVEHYATRTGNTLYLDLPGMPSALAVVDSDRRTRTYLASSDFDRTLKFHVTAPAGFAPLIQPETFSWKGPGTMGDFKVVAENLSDAKATKLDYTVTMNLRPALIPAGSYGQLIEINRRLAHPTARRLLLTKEAVKVSGR